MSEPATTAGVFAWLMTKVHWLLFVGIPLFLKVCYDWWNMRKEIQGVKADLKELNGKLDQVLKCSTENKERLIKLETKVEERTNR